MRNRETVAAVIITLNPDLDFLQKTISILLEQLCFVLIADNGSTNFEENRIKFSTTDEVLFIHDGENHGIGARANQAFAFLRQKGIQWALILDQDSLPPNNIVPEYLRVAERSQDIGIVCPLINFRNVKKANTLQASDKDFDEVKNCITSGSFVRLDAWNAVGGMNEDFFIDCVDDDFALLMLENSYKIVRCNSVVLSHDLGNAKCVRVFGGTLFLYFNKPWSRQYYIKRNTIALWKKHRQSFSMRLKRKAKSFIGDFLSFFAVKDKKTWCVVMMRAKKDAAKLDLGQKTEDYILYGK